MVVVNGHQFHLPLEGAEAEPPESESLTTPPPPGEACLVSHRCIAPRRRVTLYLVGRRVSGDATAVPEDLPWRAATPEVAMLREIEAGRAPPWASCLLSRPGRVPARGPGRVQPPEYASRWFSPRKSLTRRPFVAAPLFI